MFLTWWCSPNSENPPHDLTIEQDFQPGLFVVSNGLEDFGQALSGGNGSYSEVVKHLIAHSGASGAVVWDCNQEPFRIVAEHYSGENINLWCTKSQHEQLLRQVSENRRGAIITNDANETQSDKPPILVAPIIGSQESGEPEKLVELIFAEGKEVPDPSQKLAQLIGFCDHLRKYITVGPDRQLSLTDTASAPVATPSIDSFAQFSRAVHRSIDRADTCSNVANESRLLTQCDRVTVVLKKHGKFRIFSISGQPSVNRRSNTVQAIEKLAERVLQTSSEFWFPDDQTLAPQVREALDDYLEISATRSIAIVPVYDREIEHNEDPDDSRRRKPKVIGGIVYEHSRQQWDSNQMKPALRMVSEHCGTAIRNSQEHQGLFLYPVWRLLGKSRILTAPRFLPKALMVCGAILAFVLFLVYFQTPFYVAAEGELLPTRRQLVFPQTEGEVVEVVVDHGEAVTQGQTLVNLKSDDLSLRIEDVSGRLETLVERKGSIQRVKFRSDREEKEANDESLRAIQAEIESLQRQLEELNRIENKLTVESPIDGQVITWDIKQNLKGRVVSPQNQLMEIADTSGPWQLSLEVPDKHADKILLAWERRQSGQDDALQVRFSLASDPGQSYEGHVAMVGNEIQLNEDHQQVLRVKVELDSSAIALKKARTGVSAKLYTGEDTSMGYLWLSEIPDAFRRYVLFYFVD